MINSSDKQQTVKNKLNTVGTTVAIGSDMTQFEVINALYDSKIFSKIKLTAGARLVLIALARHYNPANKDFFPSYNCIAEHTGVSKKSVERGIKELVSANLITYRTQKVNRYRFTGYFFASVNLSVDYGQNDGDDCSQNVAQTNKKEKRNKKEEILKNSEVEKTSENQAGQKESMQEEYKQNSSCVASELKEEQAEQMFYKTNYGKYSQSEAYSCFRGENLKNPVNPYKYAKTPAYKQQTYDRKGGGSMVPSVEESAKYIESLREARKNACAPLDFPPERAKKWYDSLPVVLRKSVMARKVASKFGFDGPKFEELQGNIYEK